MVEFGHLEDLTSLYFLVTETCLLLPAFKKMLKAGSSSFHNLTVLLKFMSCKVCFSSYLHKFPLNCSFSHEECHLLMNRSAFVILCKFSKNCCKLSSQVDYFCISSCKSSCQKSRESGKSVSRQGDLNNLKILIQLLTFYC